MNKLKYSICNEIFEGWTFAATCKAAKEAGYEGIEIAPFTFGKSPNDITPDERAAIRDIALDHGLCIAGLHWLLAQTEGLHINSPNPDIRSHTSDYLIKLIDFCADIGGNIMVFGSPKQRNITAGLSKQQALDYAIETFRKIVPALEDHAITLCMEPLSCEETDFINTASEAAGLIREVNSENFQLLLDVKAMSSENTPIPHLIEENAQILRHFHANDANKRGPGFGDTDFRPIAAALKSIEYRGWVSVEVFDFSPDPVTIAKRSIEYLKQSFGE